MLVFEPLDIEVGVGYLRDEASWVDGQRGEGEAVAVGLDQPFECGVRILLGLGSRLDRGRRLGTGRAPELRLGRSSRTRDQGQEAKQGKNAGQRRGPEA